ncbi:DNA mismatch repair protein MutT [Vagococcus martis]|uniref:8-oxo-dGTP diphosphatase n=1 Tax=Vagococcus martis TaxID=1768210 RepID=A0A1V4DGY0_9ENTE|nr:(deoxy)nucleoside triphosphate pyrophosphohydrolase [Vagococcus martis]OPF87470.1 DNA mismatch repair protein MutT [Vagococcus martis]
MKKNINVVGAIIIKEGKVFCCQRGLEKSLPGKWEFPGGKIESGETKEQALVREIKEELLISVQLEEKEFASVSFDYDFGRVNLSTFICHLESGEPQLTEHLQSKWVSFDKLTQLDWAPADIPIVEKLMEAGVDE